MGRHAGWIAAATAYRLDTAHQFVPVA